MRPIAYGILDSIDSKHLGKLAPENACLFTLNYARSSTRKIHRWNWMR